MNYPFYLVDVFAIEQYTGNQLAVFTEGNALSDQQMQAFAQEINFSETTFICQTDKGYHVRIFTPNQELPFAGHPTLGTAYIIRNCFFSCEQKMNFDTVNLNLKVGEIPVTWETNLGGEEIFWMEQPAAEFGQTVSPETIAEVLSLPVKTINQHYPVQEVSTGIYFLIVPLKTLAALQEIQLNLELYEQLITSLQANSLLVFCPETYSTQDDLCVRVFAPAIGIPEDPATGSANGCLAAYLLETHFWHQNHFQIRVEQGYDMNRPSLLFLKANHNELQIGGQVKTVAKGDFIS